MADSSTSVVMQIEVELVFTSMNAKFIHLSLSVERREP
jgi:hypothetical protein